MARKSKKSQLNDLLRQAKKDFSASETQEREQRDLWVEDFNFAQVEGGQSINGTTGRGDYTDRPKFEVNKINAAIQQIVGEFRQNSFNVKVRPQNDSSKDLSDTYNGLIRNLQNSSGGDNAHNIAFGEVVNGGMGAWRVATNYESEDSFNQEIMIKPIQSAGTTVFPDPLSKDPNHRDARFMHVIQDVDRTTFAQRYPNAMASDFDASLSTLIDAYGDSWMTADKVRVSEYWFKEEAVETRLLMNNGEVLSLDDARPVLDELALKGITPVKQKNVKCHKVYRALLSGAEVLEEPKLWAGKHIPIIVVYGYNHWIDNKHYYRGVVRMAKDAQRSFNWALSTNIETVAQAPKDPWLVTMDMIPGNMRHIWENMHNRNTPFLPYKPDPAAPGGKPTREGPPQLSPALVQLQQQADIDIQSALGNFTPSQQNSRAQQSGDAILANQHQGNMATYELMDNLAGGIELEGEILLDLIPKIYDTQRQLRVMRPDGETKVVTVNQEVIDNQTGKVVKLNDLAAAKMDLFIDIGPTYASQRVENINILTRLAESNPQIGQLIPDLIAKNVDFAESEELTRRVRRFLLSQGAVEPNQEEAEELAAQQPEPPSPMEQAQMESALLDLEIKAAQVDNLNMQTKRAEAEALNFMSAAEQKSVESAETIKRLQLENKELLERIKKQQSERANKDADTLEKVSSVITGEFEAGVIDTSNLETKQHAQAVLAEAQADQMQTQLEESIDKLDQ